MSGRDVISTAMRLARDHVSNAAANAERKPTPAQKEANNYRHGHFRWRGLSISIETPKGASRSGTGADGKPWRVGASPAHYGYIKRSLGADTDHIDLYMGPNPLSPTVWIIDQVDARTKSFDEHKVMAGFSSKDEALATYRKAFSDDRGDGRIGAVTPMGIGQFKRWLSRGDTTKAVGM